MGPLILSALVSLGVLGAAGLLFVAWQVRTAPAVPPPAAALGLKAVRTTPERSQLGRLASLAAPRDEEALRMLRVELMRAGYLASGSVRTYMLARSVLALALASLAIIFRPEGVLAAMATVLVATGLGYYLPWIVVRWQRNERRRAMVHAFPDALDMLVSAVEAGLSLDAALVSVARELQEAAPELGYELTLLNAEVATGVNRDAALEHLALRTGLPEVSALSNVLGQSARFGAGVASSLRAHSELARKKRLLEAERKAAEASPKLTIAMILFILPPLFVVLIGPTIVNIVQRLMPVLNGMTL